MQPVVPNAAFLIPGVIMSILCSVSILLDFPAYLLCLMHFISSAIPSTFLLQLTEGNGFTSVKSIPLSIS